MRERFLFHGTSSAQIERIVSSHYDVNQLWVTTSSDDAWVHARYQASKDQSDQVVIYLDPNKLIDQGKLVHAASHGEVGVTHFTYSGPLESAVVRTIQRQRTTL